MSRIFIPLRSNGSWFLDKNSRSELNLLIKNYMIIYDEIVFQDLRYNCAVGETGSIDFMINPDNANLDRTKIHYFTPGESFKLLIGPEGKVPTQQIMNETAIAAYEVDFYPIIHEAGLLTASYFNWVKIDISEEDKKYIKKEIGTDLRLKELTDLLPSNQFLRNKYVESFYFDSMLALRMRLPLLVNEKLLPIIQWKNSRIKHKWFPSVNEMIFKNWIKIGLPNIADSSWEEIDEFRQSLAGEDFRRMIERISNKVNYELKNVESSADIKSIISDEFSKELVEEIKARLRTRGRTGLNVLLNLLPGGALLSSSDEISSLVEQEQSWVSLLKRK